MPNQIRIKRSTGSTAPATLANAELAYTEGDGRLFIGVGTGGAGGTATSIVQIGGSSVASAITSTRSAGVVFAGPASGTAAAPTFTGIPAAPTASAGTNTTQIATTAYVSTAISNLVNGAGSALDTLKELADALGNDANFSTTITTSIGGKLAKADNLSDLGNAGTARTNLGLGSMATQNANNVSITGGSIDGVTIDCGTF